MWEIQNFPHENVHRDDISLLGNVNLAKYKSNSNSSSNLSLKYRLCVTSRRVFLQHCSIGFKSGEYLGSETKTNLSLMS